MPVQQAMHEFLLYSQIPHGRLNQVLNVFAGLTAAQPRQFCEQQLIYQQTELAKTSSSKKTAAAKQNLQQQRLSFHKLVRDVTFENGGLKESGPWRHRVENVPEPGVKTVTSRVVSDVVIDDAVFETFRGGSTSFRYVDQFLLHGSRFVNGNVVIKIMNVLLPPEGTGALEPLDAPMPGFTEFRLLDRSGAYLIEASIRLVDGTDSKLSEQATQELMALRKVLDGAIDLRVPDRLSLDTRVKTI